MSSKILISLSACLFLASCGDAPAPDELPLDVEFLTSSLWNDGQAEVAFYQVDRSRDQYGAPGEQSFLTGTYLVKHDFDRSTQAKATESSTNPTSAFKYALFYEFESGSYEYKRSWVVNLAQNSLGPLKASFASFDWCSNQYREYSFDVRGRVDHLFRSDDYGNAADQWRYDEQIFPHSALPLLVRALDEDATFRLLNPDGSTTEVQAIVSPADDSLGTVRVDLAYEASMPSMIGEDSDLQESWWRGTGEDRKLVSMRSSTGRYQMNLVEHIRSPYWEEDVYDRLKLTQERP